MLSLKNNRIPSIVDEKYCELLRIKKVDLSHNLIVYFLNNGIFLAPQTEELSLKGNLLTKFPEIIGTIKTLKKLDLSGNRIESIPDDIFDNLLDLEDLDLSFNRLTYLPISIGKLTKLKYLNLAGNKIPTLPAEVENLVSLKRLELAGNPIDRVPVEIEAQGTQGIINYYLSLGEGVKLYEAKLLIVGQGNVGKTFLMNRLLLGKTPATETTEGIDIKSWYTNTELSEKFRINVWDFGGQEIYHSTHQFFLTKRSLYLLVWEARTDQHLISFDYWLNVIRLLSNESPIIMVLNKIDERKLNIDEKSLRDKFKNVISFHKVSAYTGENIEGLAEDIRQLIDKLPLIGDRLPKVWVEIREDLELEATAHNYISLKEYLEICNKRGLSNKKALLLSQYFHDLGVFLHFQEHYMLKNIVFLKPEWATNAVYKIIDAKYIIENNGEFSSSDLEPILEDYPMDKHPYLIELMKKFELCFQLENNKFLVPELLKPEKIAFNWDYADNLKLEYHYDFMPAGILARFIVRVREMVDNNLYWKNGVIIKREQTQALVISDQFSRKIQIWVVGQNKGLLLEVIRKELQHINDTLNYPLVPEKIPCNCQMCEKSLSPHLFSYEFVRKAANTFKTIHCEKSILGVNVLNLMGLYSIKAPDSSEVKYTTETLLYDIIEISTRILERKNTKKIENLLNDDITDLLRTKGYSVTDQTRSGASGTSANTSDAGEIDIMIRNNRGMPISIIECFRLESCGEKNTVVDKHIDKLLNNYDTNGIKRNFIIVFSEAKSFTKLWDNYTRYLNDLNDKDNFSSNIPFCGLTRKPELTEGYTDLKVVIARHEREGEEIEVVHIGLNLFNS